MSDEVQRSNEVDNLWKVPGVDALVPNIWGFIVG